MRHFYQVLIIISIAFLISCEPTSVNHMTVQEVKLLLENDHNYSLIDVRTPAEYSDGAISGALNIDVKSDAFLSETEKLNKEDPFILYCRSGKRSLKAYKLMTAAGFKNLLNLEGGYLAYSKK